MQVSRIQANYFTNCNNVSLPAKTQTVRREGLSGSENLYKSVPAGFKYNANIHFGEFFDPNRTVPHIDFEEYMAMKPHRKTFFRKRYSTFFSRVDKNELYSSAQRDVELPLTSPKTMDAFIDTAKIYAKYKDQPIICLGRSPKWFLNAALWMKDGIDNYNFVAFSKYWFRPNYEEGMKVIPSAVPTEKEEAAYRKYLRRVKSDPKTIVNNFEKTGKKTVITDYICTGKGVCSFLDVMSRYADDLGILDKFAKAIQIVGIGSMDYMEALNPYADTYSIPSVIMPPKLRPYDKYIKQEFYDMDYTMFKDMLLNQNVNECRSTYYPHETWTVYQPDRFKTGLIKDMKKVKQMVKELKGNTKCMSSFTPAMFDFRNLLNFHILDGLNQRGLLKAIHRSRI